MSINTQIVIWNANGLCKSKPEVEHYIKTNQVDVMLVSETHLTTRSHFNIPGYEIINAFHPGNRMRAGASVIVKRGIEFEELELVQLDWFQCAKICLMTQTGEIIIAAAYLPPRHTINKKDLTLQLMNLGPKFILGGDFNAKYTWWGSRVVNPKGTTLYKCILDLGCIVHSTGEPTYWPSLTYLILPLAKESTQSKSPLLVVMTFVQITACLKYSSTPHTLKLLLKLN